MLATDIIIVSIRQDPSMNFPFLYPIPSLLFFPFPFSSLTPSSFDVFFFTLLHFRFFSPVLLNEIPYKVSPQKVSTTDYLPPRWDISSYSPTHIYLHTLTFFPPSFQSPCSQVHLSKKRNKKKQGEIERDSGHVYYSSHPPYFKS